MTLNIIQNVDQAIFVLRDAGEWLIENGGNHLSGGN